MHRLEKFKQKHNCLVLTAILVLSLVVYLTSNNVLSVDGETLFLQTDLETAHEENTTEQFDEDPTKGSSGSKGIFQSFQYIQKSTYNVFFIETRCTTNKSAEAFKNSGDLVLTARQSCAIESTARANPDRKIYVLLSCLPKNVSCPFLQELAALPAVKLGRLDIEGILEGSPAQRLLENSSLESSVYPVEHSSDILRLALLWKYGGTYIDLDVVTIRSLEPLGTDWVGMQDFETIANGVMNVSPSGLGHELLGRALDRVAEHYDPGTWSANGPELITPLILKMCSVDQVITAVKECQNFTVFNSSVLYPIYYPNWGALFDVGIGPHLVEELEQKAYSIHIWNKMSHERKVELNSTAAYALLARRYCPSTAASVREF